LLYKLLPDLSVADAQVAITWLLAWEREHDHCFDADLLSLKDELLVSPMTVLLKVHYIIIALATEPRGAIRNCIRVNRKRRKDRAKSDERILVAVNRHTYGLLLALQKTVASETFQEITLDEVIKLGLQQVSSE
jgi:hypothetical protein